MSYTINKTDGSVLLTLQDGTVNDEIGLWLIGRNATNFGDYQNENFVRLLENFADNIPPSQSSAFNPLEGTIWYDTTTEKIKVFDGTNWNPVSERFVANTTPATAKVGDQWYDTSANQLKSYTGTQWLLVGPGYTSSQGKSGAIVETIVDANVVSHTVINSYTNGNLISVTSFDSEFTPILGSGYSGFTTIRPGVNLLSNVVLNGTATNSNKVGGLFANVFARVDVNSTFAGDISVTGALVLANSNVYTSGGTLNIQNTAYNGNISFYVNGPAGNTRPLFIDASTSSVNVPYPTAPTHAASKNYADTEIATVNTRIGVTNSTIISNIANVRADTSANLTTAITTVNANSAVSNAAIYSNIGNLTVYTVNSVNTLYNNEVYLESQITTIANVIANLATQVNPNLTGNATLDGNLIANTAYVSATTTALTNNFTNVILGLAQSAQANLVAATATLAPINSPVFTGNARAPTPGVGDNSARIATTAFVGAALSQQRFNYTVSTSDPTGGNNGDFWFKV